MSIAIATICTDGLAMCADRQLGTSHFKYYECKLSKIALVPERGTVLVSYAGSPDVMKVVLQDLRSRLQNQDKGHEQIQKDLQESLDAALPKNPKNVHQLLFGFSEAGTFHLLKSYNRTISPVPVWDCIGFGDSALTRYLGAIFLGTGIHLPVFRAVPICNYMVAQAKKYIPWCGGLTDLMVATPEGGVLEQTATTAIDNACELVEVCLNLLLTAATEPGVSAEHCHRLIENLRNVVESQSKLFTAFLDKH